MGIEGAIPAIVVIDQPFNLAFQFGVFPIGIEILKVHHNFMVTVQTKGIIIEFFGQQGNEIVPVLVEIDGLEGLGILVGKDEFVLGLFLAIMHGW